MTATPSHTADITVHEVCAAIERLAPLGLALSWDRCGLQIGMMNAPANRILLTLSVSRSAYMKARDAGAQVIVSHHPIIWDSITALHTDDPHTRLCLDIAAAGIACYCAHTNLDICQGGVNDALAHQLGLEKVRPLLRADHAALVKLVVYIPKSHLAPLREAVCTVGAGTIGEYTFCTYSSPGTGTFLPGNKTSPYTGTAGCLSEEPEHRFETLVPSTLLNDVIQAMKAVHPYEEPAYDIIPLNLTDPRVGLGRCGQLPEPLPLARFAHLVREKLNVNHVRLAGKKDNYVQSVAVIGGSGAGELNRIPADIDVLVTGDVKLHDAEAACRRELAVIDASHEGTERPVLPVLADYLTKQIQGIEVIVHHEIDMFECITI